MLFIKQETHMIELQGEVDKVRHFENKINALLEENKKLHDMLNEKLNEMQNYKASYDDLMIQNKSLQFYE